MSEARASVSKTIPLMCAFCEVRVRVRVSVRVTVRVII